MAANARSNTPFELNAEAAVFRLTCIEDRIDSLADEMSKECTKQASVLGSLSQRLESVTSVLDRVVSDTIYATKTASQALAMATGLAQEESEVDDNQSKNSSRAPSKNSSRSREEMALEVHCESLISKQAAVHREQVVKATDGMTRLGRELMQRLQRLDGEVAQLRKSEAQIVEPQLLQKLEAGVQRIQRFEAELADKHQQSDDLHTKQQQEFFEELDQHKQALIAHDGGLCVHEEVLSLLTKRMEEADFVIKSLSERLPAVSTGAKADSAYAESPVLAAELTLVHERYGLGLGRKKQTQQSSDRTSKLVGAGSAVVAAVREGTSLQSPEDHEDSTGITDSTVDEQSTIAEQIATAEETMAAEDQQFRRVCFEANHPRHLQAVPQSWRKPDNDSLAKAARGKYGGGDAESPLPSPLPATPLTPGKQRLHIPVLDLTKRCAQKESQCTEDELMAAQAGDGAVVTAGRTLPVSEQDIGCEAVQSSQTVGQFDLHGPAAEPRSIVLRAQEPPQQVAGGLAQQNTGGTTCPPKDVANKDASVEVAKAVENAMTSQFEQSQHELSRWWEERKEAALRITANLFNDNDHPPSENLQESAMLGASGGEQAITTPSQASGTFSSAPRLVDQVQTPDAPRRSASVQRLIAAGFTLEPSSKPSSLRAPSRQQASASVHRVGVPTRMMEASSPFGSARFSIGPVQACSSSVPPRVAVSGVATPPGGVALPRGSSPVPRSSSLVPRSSSPVPRTSSLVPRSVSPLTRNSAAMVACPPALMTSQHGPPPRTSNLALGGSLQLQMQAAGTAPGIGVANALHRPTSAIPPAALAAVGARSGRLSPPRRTSELAFLFTAAEPTAVHNAQPKAPEQTRQVSVNSASLDEPRHPGSLHL